MQSIEYNYYNAIGFQGSYKIEVCDDNNMVIKDYGWKPNLILNIGLNEIFNRKPDSVINYCYLGTGAIGTEPLEYLGGAITASWTGNTVTFSGAGCPNLVQYRTIKFIEANVAAFITAVGSVNSVTVRETAPTPISTNTFKIYATERYKLVSQLKQNTSLSSTISINQNTKTIYYNNAYDFAIETVSQNYTECGVGWVNAANPANLFSRVIFDSTVPVLVGRKMRILYSLSAIFSPIITPVNVNWLVTGWSLSAGQSLIEYLTDSLYPTGVANIGISSGSVALTSRTTLVGFPLVEYKLSSIVGSYIQQSLSCVKQAVFASAEGNGVNGNPTKSIIVGDLYTTNTLYPAYKFLFNTPALTSLYPTKTVGHTLTLSYNITWGRTL